MTFESNAGWCSGSTRGSGPCSLGSNPSPAARPYRLEAQDTTLSRWRHGFESR